MLNDPLPDIYHITNVSNLSSIIRQGGIYCDSAMQKRGITSTSIAYPHIKERRVQKSVNVAKGGTLADYVPFYFAPRSPMLYAIRCGNVEGYQGGQERVVHLVASVAAIVDAGCTHAFTDGHAVIHYSEFFDDLSKLNQIDWPLMNEKYWRDTPEDPDRMRRRQAEFLIYRFFPWKLINTIGVMNNEIDREVNNRLVVTDHRPPVVVHREWYY